jgi:hydrogenase/urease accessory protein HupE
LVSTCFSAAACCLLAITAEAHDPGLSAAHLQIERGRLAAHLTFARSDLESLTAAKPALPESLDWRVRLEQLATSALEIKTDERPIAATALATTLDESTGAVHFEIVFAIGAGTTLGVRSPLIRVLPRGHRQYISIKDAGGDLIGERMLDATNDAFELSLAQTASETSFRQFVVLGVEHILTGYDHLAFLLGLLIAGASLGAVARIITSFTVGHSITLALATLDLVGISPSVVEPIIAASIVYVGLENILRRDLRRRWLLTFGFGLVHGFGFASALKELGIGSGMGAAVPLLSFNLGVELGQIAIAALVLPVIWKVKQRPAFVLRFAPACSFLISLAGTVWLLQRTLLK